MSNKQQSYFNQEKKENPDDYPYVLHDKTSYKKNKKIT